MTEYAHILVEQRGVHLARWLVGELGAVQDVDDGLPLGVRELAW